MMSDEPKSQLLFYQTKDGRTRVEVRMQGETVWLSLNQMAELFQRDKSVVSKHIKNVFEEGDLSPEATVAKFATVQDEGGRTAGGLQAISRWLSEAIPPDPNRRRMHPEGVPASH
jgi:hypothetical protein